MNIAVVLAGGVGHRMGADKPKQFLQLAGRQVIEYSISTFDAHPGVDEVAVVVHPDYRADLQAIVERNNWPKLKKIIEGGSERYLSTLSAIRAYADQPEANLLLHDAARPLVSAEVVTRLIKALATNAAVAVVLPSVDTVFCVESGKIIDVPPRSSIMCAQTPQAFRHKVISQAYTLALKDPAFTATDDCGVLHHYLPEVPIAVVEGEPQNMKITHPADIDILSKYFQ
ncbi:MAG: 2-C-methyl-D-erythritol 4-phosphate cytidylyltransferase [Bacteroidales bacterium]|nr:2-C-methyl-D-erythritol 4-phosphate cytidylyltransferase [Bacteroidales bacterium]